MLLLSIQSIESKKDTTTIWVPPPKVPFGPQPTTVHTKTTYFDHENEKIKAMMQQNLIVVVLMVAMSFKFGIHLPLVREGCAGFVGSWETSCSHERQRCAV